MIEQVIPRCLHVAHWLNDNAQPMTAHDLSKTFGVGTKAISDDFAKIRRRGDIIEYSEKKLSQLVGVDNYLKSHSFIHTRWMSVYVHNERTMNSCR